MKIDVEKMKSVLQAVEDQPTYPSEIYFVFNCKLHGVKATPCDNATIYQCVILEENGFLVGESMAPGKAFRVDRLTSLGHDILAKMNDKGVWPKIKDALSTVRSVAEFLTALAPFFPPGWIETITRKIRG